MSKRGAFIVFEGLDRCGKTTQINLLVSALSKISTVHEISFPDRTTETGKLCDAYLTNKSNINIRAVHLLFSANRWDKMQWIKNTLEKGEHIICSRYAYSGVAYTASNGLDRKWCKSPDIGLIEPDAVFYLKIDPSTAAKRKGYGNEIYEKEKIQAIVMENFEAIFEEDNYKNIKVIKASERSIEDIAQEIEESAKNVIEEVKNKPIGTLWTE
ncbi:hypothetical protein ABK040_004512 [Willaertia magna]